VVGATISGAAVAGSYAVDVKQLAQGQILNSATQKADNTAIGTGTTTAIKVEFGSINGKSFTPGDSKNTKTITIDNSNNSLQGIASAFSAAGIDAKVVKSGNNYALSIQGQSGVANSLRISVSGDTALKNLVSYNPSGTSSGLTQAKAAQDTLLTVNGTAFHSATRTVTSAIGGTALAVTGTGSSTVAITKDSSQIVSNVTNLVQAYNSLNGKLQALQKGDLKSDNALGQASSQLKQVLSSVSASALGNAGISVDSKGNLQLDSSKLKAAVTADPDAVSQLFANNGNGLADKLATRIGTLTGDSGSIHHETAAVSKEIDSVNGKKAALSKALTAQATALANLYSQQEQASAAAKSGNNGLSVFNFLA
jgi:flagellar hook-associated protein 2